MTLQALATDPLITLGGFAFGVLGVVLAVVFYAKSKKEKSPCYEVKSTTLIEGLHIRLEGLQLQYKGIPQERICVTKLSLWNAGHQTIDKLDVVPNIPFGISCPPGVKILDAKITSVSTPATACAALAWMNDNERSFIPLQFDYLDHDDFMIVQIVHDGDEECLFQLKGKIKGVKQIECNPRPDASTLIARKLPFMEPLLPLFANRIFMKYIVSLTYLAAGGFAGWHIIAGNTAWYMWLLAGFCGLSTFVMYFGMGRLSPAKI